jgi:hypothetical protein
LYNANNRAVTDANNRADGDANAITHARRDPCCTTNTTRCSIATNAKANDSATCNGGDANGTNKSFSNGSSDADGDAKVHSNGNGENNAGDWSSQGAPLNNEAVPVGEANWDSLIGQHARSCRGRVKGDLW